jgi:hypothetical protein
MDVVQTLLLNDSWKAFLGTGIKHHKVNPKNGLDKLYENEINTIGDCSHFGIRVNLNFYITFYSSQTTPSKIRGSDSLCSRNDASIEAVL